ncbi:unnamed protein product [Cochlearia groenlandica]
MDNNTITLGSSSLSSSSVHKIASCVANVRIESSAIDEGVSIETTSSKRSSFGIPKDLTKEEFRASLVVLLNKLLLSSSGSVLPVKILKVLDDSKADETFDFGDIVVDVNERERIVLDNSCASLIGLSCLIDHKATALSQIVDSVAALTCEATKSDVTLFQSLISGDGLGNKDDIAVARLLNGLLKGSEAVGKFVIQEISEIPRIHGNFRDDIRTLHSDTRFELNITTVYSSGDSGVGEVFGITLWVLSRSLKTLGEYSFLRAKLCYESIANKNLRKGLSQLFEKCCVKYDKLKKGYNLIEKDYCKFAHELNESLGIVWSIVGFEAAAAFFALAGGELFVKKTNVDAENKEPETDDKRNKEKSGAVLGKGTGMIIQFIKDRLVNCSGRDQMELLEKWMEQISNLFNPEGYCLDSLLEKLKEIVQSNENSFKLPKGTRDFGKDKMLVREKAFSIVQKVFKRHGATAIHTPVYDFTEALLGNYGEDSKLIYDIADQDGDGELCSLRYDLTVPFARYVAMNGFQHFKRYQIAKVYRRDNVSKGRFREFYQCDFDIAGSYERMEPDIEVVKILTELLDELEIGDYEVKVNHRKLLNGMLEICGVPPEKFTTICSSIDKLDKQSFEQVKKEMVEVKGLSSEIADRIGKLVEQKGDPMEVLSKLSQEGSEFLANEPSKEALDDLSVLFKALERSKCIHKIVFDLSLARGLDYYTGVIFEAVCIGAEVGSIGAGGRYDNLIGKFGKEQVPAVGMSLGIERVLFILEDLNKQQKKETETETQVLVSIMRNSNEVDGKALREAAELVSQLWKADIKAELLVHKRWDKHIVRAKGIPWMVFVGKEELKKGVVTLKKIDGRSVVEEVKNVPRDSFVAELLKRL